MMATLKVENLWMEYGAQTVLERVNLDVAEGELVNRDFFQPSEFIANCRNTSWLVHLSIDSVKATNPKRNTKGNWTKKLLGEVKATVTARIVKATGFELSMPQGCVDESLEQSFKRMGFY